MNLSRFALRSLVLLIGLGIVGLLMAAGGFYAVKWLYTPELPPVEEIRELPLQVPLRIYTADGQLIGEYGAERRAPLNYEEIPPRLIQAFLAAEDDRYFEHPGVDYQGLLRAAWQLALTGRKSQGGSTITMQLARNFFLSNERTYTRKIKEILLALEMEEQLSKEQILETYLNKIYLGNRAYGVGAAAQVYFAKPVADLSLSEMAILAGLPKAPSRDNPANSTQRARNRRNYVLRRMHELGHINDLELELARAEPVQPAKQNTNVAVEAQYLAEMVRGQLYEQYGEDLYTAGFEVTTTLQSARQRAAVKGLRQALIDYDERHGYRGPETTIQNPDLLAGQEIASQQSGADEEGEEVPSVLEQLDALPQISGMPVAVVSESSLEQITALTRAHGLITLPASAYEWAKFSEEQLPQRGQVIRLLQTDNGFRLSQLPEVQGAFVSLDPHDGSIQALAGGFDYFLGKFNRVTQARRQPGSGFKPFLYSAALAYGFTPASVILDAPVVFDDPTLEDTWRPQNYSGKFYGPTRLREALVHSRNLVSIRLLQAIGIDYARRTVSQFGFPIGRMPRDLSLALGSPTFTPLEMAKAYAVLANGGYEVQPYFIQEIRTAFGEVLFAAKPVIACQSCEEERLAQAAAGVAAADTAAAESEEPDAEPLPELAPRVADPRVVYLMNDILRDVTTRGTAAKARQLGRSDLHGKTGTTNDETDAWFYGFTPDLVGVAWVGFDQPTPLGRGEVGGRAALPMWLDYMKVALKDMPQTSYSRPPGLVNVRINPENGKLAAAGSPSAIFELVQSEHIPEPDDAGPVNPYEPDSDGAGLEDIF